jgi:hypothetical protein
LEECVGNEQQTYIRQLGDDVFGLVMIFKTMTRAPVVDILIIVVVALFVS